MLLLYKTHFDSKRYEKQISPDVRLDVARTYYLQARSYVADAFGTKIYGKYGVLRADVGQLCLQEADIKKLSYLG